MARLSYTMVYGLCILWTPLAHAQAPEAARVSKIAAWMAPGTYCATPTIEDRAFWSRVGQSKHYDAVVAEAEKLRQETFRTLPDDLYLEYSRNGNRSRYQNVFFRKLDALRAMVIAECLDNRGRFLKPLQELVASYAADKTWVLPAHDGNLDNFEGRQITIDLFASEVACELASADHILGQRLDEATRALVRSEAERRIFQPYTGMVTAGKPSRAWLLTTNNWNAVCLANVTGTALALRETPADKAFYVAAAEKYVANFLRGFTDDGYCSEGIGYWNYGYGCFVRLDHMVSGATGGKLKLSEMPKAQNAGLFARRIEIIPGMYPAFADCSVGATPSREIMSYVSRRYGFSASAWEQQGFSDMRWLGDLGTFSFVLDEPASQPAAEQTSARDWFETAGILVCRGARTASGLPVGVALKGGHNAEHHNHNDVGSYVYCLGTSMPLVDPGAEEYTRRTFSRDRYVSGVLNSFGHPVPHVAGELQRTGRAAEAKVLELAQTDDRDTLRLDLASAYAVKSLKRLTRTFDFQRSTAGLTITDEVEFESPESFGTAVITFDDWKQVADDQLRVGAGTGAVRIRIDAGGLPVKVVATVIDEDVRGGKQPTRIGIDLAAPVKQASIRLTVLPGTDKE